MGYKEFAANALMAMGAGVMLQVLVLFLCTFTNDVALKINIKPFFFYFFFN
jgi:hypothetical protein